jgi:hypothetical protein
MKTLIGIVLAMSLCACGSAPQVQMSSSVNGQPSPSMDFTDPHFYMDDDKSPPNFATPSRYHAVDGICMSRCQSRGGAADYCSRGCGY